METTIQYDQDQCAFKLFAEMQKAAIRAKDYKHKNIKLDVEFMGMEVTVNFTESKKATIDGKQLESILAYALGHTVRLSPGQFNEVTERMKKELGL